MRNEDWALTEPVAESHCHIDYEHHRATLTNGKIIAIVNQKDKLPFTVIHTNPVAGVLAPAGEIGEDESSHGQYVSALNLEGREFRPIQGGKYSLKARFEATEGEKNLRDGPISAGQSGSQRMRARTGPAQLSGLGALYALKSGLRIFMEQSGGRPRDVRPQRDRVGSSNQRAAGLLDHRWRYPGRN